MRVSLIVTGGFIQHQNEKKAALETERLMAFFACVQNLNTLDTSKGDEIIFAEYGLKSRLKNLSETGLNRVNHKYVFVEGSGFNQSKIKNAGAEAANNEIVCWINSDVIVEANIFDVIRARFEKNPNSFVTLARHDVFAVENKDQFRLDINNPSSYTAFDTKIDDAGWHHAVKKPQTPIPTMIKAFVHPNYQNRVVHDFVQGYINYGELMAVTKEIWKKYPFDEEITAIVDSYLRDIIFGNEENFQLELIHNETAIFHLSGSDYMQQTETGTDKYKRLIEDIIKAARKYPCMHHWLVFSYFREFDEAIKELQIPFKQILETWRTPLMWQFYRDKERVKELYGVTE